ncbi:hypothetical protein HK101_000910 [Irineochytrium annulatum]|nr:hypothetical protein HK101_000910 [Irineochytrium annulatum]
MNGTYNEPQLQRFSDESEYFGYLGKDSLVGAYQLVTADTQTFWHNWMLNTYGPNNLTDKSFYFSKDTVPGNNAALGFIADTDTAARKPLIDFVRTTGSTAVSPRVRLASATTSASGIIVMAPIFKNATSGSLQKGLTDHMETIAYSAITCSQAMQNALGVIALGEGIHVFLFDTDGAVNTTFLAHYSVIPSPVFDNFTYVESSFYFILRAYLYLTAPNTTSISAPLTNVDVLSMIHSDLVFREHFMFLERNWELIIIAEKGFIDSERTNFPLILIVIALIEPTVGLLLHATVMIMRLACPQHVRDHK